MVGSSTLLSFTEGSNGSQGNHCFESMVLCKNIIYIHFLVFYNVLVANDIGAP